MKLVGVDREQQGKIFKLKAEHSKLNFIKKNLTNDVKLSVKIDRNFYWLRS